MSLKTVNTITFQSETRTLGEDWGTAEFYTVFIDGVQIADSAHAFSASTPEVALSECDFCYHCGRPDTLVRRLDREHVIWFSLIEEGYTPQLRPGTIYKFSATEYQERLGGSVDDLPDLQRSDFEHLLAILAPPNWEDALYTIPELPRDKFGKRILKTINDNLAFGEFAFSPPPTEFQELRIGIDTKGYPETAILLAKSDQGSIIQFNANPYIPVWMSFVNNSTPFDDILDGSEIAT